MLVQVSKVFAKFINEMAKIKGFSTCAHVVEVSENFYKWNIDIFGPRSDRDFNYKTGKYKVLAVEYPFDYYAPTCYLDSDKLINSARAAGVHDIDSCRDWLQDLLSI